MKKLAIAPCLLVLLGVARSSAAAVPLELTQEGRLLNTDGTPETGSIAIAFALYEQGSGGTAVWTENQTVTLDDGYFSTELGSVTPLTASLFDGATKYLGITLAGESEMTPRETLTSVPYAVVAGDVNGDINPTSVSIGGKTVINAQGAWVGPLTGLAGTPGPAGATGAQGPAGPAGAAGPTGSAGPAGAAGAAGAKGATGATGATGASGATGLTGAVGPTGPAGPTGAAGTAGAAGAKGATGATGAAGAAGAAGATGATGLTGSTGLTGAVGPTGAAGAPGATGSNGITSYHADNESLGRSGPTLPASGTTYMMVGGQSITIGASQSIIATLTAGGFITSGGALNVGVCYQSGAATPVLLGEAMPYTTPASDSPITVATAAAIPQGTYTIGVCAEQPGGTGGILWEAVISGWVIVTN